MLSIFAYNYKNLDSAEVKKRMQLTQYIFCFGQVQDYKMVLTNEDAAAIQSYIQELYLQVIENYRLAYDSGYISIVDFRTKVCKENRKLRMFIWNKKRPRFPKRVRKSISKKKKGIFNIRTSCNYYIKSK